MYANNAQTNGNVKINTCGILYKFGMDMCNKIIGKYGKRIAVYRRRRGTHLSNRYAVSQIIFQFLFRTDINRLIMIGS